MKIFAALLALLASSLAFAGTTVSFDSPTSCLNYCSGYTTYSSEHTVGYVNDVYQGGGLQSIVVSFDGVNYKGPGVEIAITGGNPHYATISDAVLLALDGSGRTITFYGVVEVKSTTVNSGRAHYTRTTRFVRSGTVTLP